jgi:hypothetical protein
MRSLDIIPSYPYIPPPLCFGRERASDNRGPGDLRPADVPARIVFPCRRLTQTCLRGGAPGGAAVRWRSFARSEITARGGLGTGLANPSERASQTRSGKVRPAVRSNAPAATKGPRKPLAPPGAPFPSREGNGNGTGQPAALSKTGGAALAWALPASFRGASEARTRNP